MVEACQSTLMGCFREQIKLRYNKDSLKTYCLTHSSNPCNIILHAFLCCLCFFLRKAEVVYICVQKGNPAGKTSLWLQIKLGWMLLIKIVNDKLEHSCLSWLVRLRGPGLACSRSSCPHRWRNRDVFGNRTGLFQCGPGVEMTPACDRIQRQLPRPLSSRAGVTHHGVIKVRRDLKTVQSNPPPAPHCDP